MCIACRKRDLQRNLIRFQIKNHKITPYCGKGRSSYLCNDCLKNSKNIKRVAKRLSIDFESFEKLLKELNING